MNYRKTLIAASIITSLCMSGAIYAQDATPSGTSQAQQSAARKAQEIKHAETLNAVVVTGIRATQAMSLDTKRDAESHIEVVSAVDIGKLPAKNIADTIAQLPGVNISDAAGAEGGFDEADHVSLRGTAPGLTLTTANGHAVGSGDWFGGSTRSVSYAMLPSEIVSQVVVHKTSEARLLEGGAAGSIDIITRKPLEFGKSITAEGTVGGVYSSLPDTTKPQFNGLFNWKNKDNTFGVMVQGFYEDRALQRDGQEMQGYAYIPSNSKVAKQLGRTGTNGSASSGVFYPDMPGAVLFTQERQRKGGSIDLEWKPLDNLTLNLDGFYTQMNATNYNRNYELFVRGMLPNATLTNYQLQGNVLTSASIAANAKVFPGVYGMISRPDQAESSRFYTLDAHWKATSNLDFKFQAGTTKGEGNSPTQNVMQMGTGAGEPSSYAMNGLGTPLDWTMGGANNTFNPMTVALSSIFGVQDLHLTDKEDWFQADGEFDFDDAGALSSLQFGIRYARHANDSPTSIAQVANSDAQKGLGSTVYPAAGGNYPGSFASDLGVGQMPSDIWYWTNAQLAALNAAYADRAVTGDLNSRLYPIGFTSITEDNGAAYLQVNFDGNNWGGNFGLRYVSTDEAIGYTSASIIETDHAGPYMNSAFFKKGWYWNYYKTHYGKVLPSFNLKVNLNDDGSLLARFAASQTLTRQDYGQLAGSVGLTDPTAVGDMGSGSGPNPYLKPLISTNFDASLEWYFATRGLLSASVYEMDLHNYYDYGATTHTYLNDFLTYGGDVGSEVIPPSPTPVYSNYLVSVPINVNGTVKGVELNYIQPIGDHFGTSVNYTYANGHSTGGTYLYNPDGTLGNNVPAPDRPLYGTSRTTANFSAYYEDSRWNARINYTYRSSFYDGMMTTNGNLPLLPYYAAGHATLSFSAGYTLNDHVSFSFDAMNLNKPRMHYYVLGSQAGLDFGKEPEAFYVNGRQYYLNVNFKL